MLKHRISVTIVGHGPEFQPAEPSAVERVSRRLGVSPEAIMGRDRSWRPVYGRQLAMALIRREQELSLPQIGRIFHRDHTTVLHALRKVERNPEMVALVAELSTVKPRPIYSICRDLYMSTAPTPTP